MVTVLVFITAVINEHKERNIASFDITGAFLHADIDEVITMVLKGRLAERMVQVAPNLYRKNITVNRKGTAILYVKMQKSLYGLLRSALLFYKKIVADLESDGFVLNPYDSCVANKVVNGKQMTICWHVNDLKVSHCDPAQVTITIFREWLSRKYGVAVVTHRGKVHDYLHQRKGDVYHDGIHQEYHQGLPIGDHTGTKTYPAADHLFTVRDPSLAKAKVLPEELAMAFHRTMAQLLFLSTRV